jgi:hypothetical protein
MPAPADAETPDSQQLWKRVEDMEKRCRNSAPTVLAPELIYLQAD